MFLRRSAPPEQILGIQGLKARLREPSAALGRVDPYASQLIKLLDGHNDRLSVPVGRHQVARLILLLLAGDMDAVPPVAAAGGQKQI